MLIQKERDAPELWFAAGFGRLVAAQEQRFCDRLAADSFGFYGVQLGMPNRRLMRRSPVLHRASIGTSGCDITADWSALPLAGSRIADAGAVRINIGGKHYGRICCCAGNGGGLRKDGVISRICARRLIPSKK